VCERVIVVVIRVCIVVEYAELDLLVARELEDLPACLRVEDGTVRARGRGCVLVRVARARLFAAAGLRDAAVLGIDLVLTELDEERVVAALAGGFCGARHGRM
jgi:hypothetical protein